jgi:hypothetical protein
MSWFPLLYARSPGQSLDEEFRASIAHSMKLHFPQLARTKQKFESVFTGNIRADAGADRHRTGEGVYICL